jgi:aminobenzoyl-glutamate utilization protein A
LIVAGTSAAHEVDADLTVAGAAPNAGSDARSIRAVVEAARITPGVRDIVESVVAEASDDATTMMRHVQDQGGTAGYVMIGSDLPDGHHTPRFDIDEQVIGPGIGVLSRAALGLLAQEG